MAGAIQDLTTVRQSARPRRATEEGPAARCTLILLSVGFFAAFLLLPLVVVFVEGFRRGAALYFQTFTDPATLDAIKLTLLTAGCAVPANALFGVAAAWAITRFEFRGKQFFSTLIDLPLWVSPVIGGLVYALLFGSQGVLGPWLQAHHWRIIYATPGIVLATVFVTFPFIARGLIPLMQAQGMAEEEAALTLGARGWQVFLRVTLPKIKWGLLYGVILANARAMGEFGAVSVISGHISGLTNTVPLQIEILYNEYAFASAFALASLLSLLALATLGVKTYVEWRARQQLEQSQS